MVECERRWASAKSFRKERSVNAQAPSTGQAEGRGQRGGGSICKGELMTQLAQSDAPADTDHTAEIAPQRCGPRGIACDLETVFTRALADILAGEDPDPGTRQLNLMMGQRAAAADQRDADRSRQRSARRARLRCGRAPGPQDLLEGRRLRQRRHVSWGSETPWDAQQSFRVVTIMLASDW
jgi:hypothetical protein